MVIKQIKKFKKQLACEGQLLFVAVKPEDTINGLSFRKDNKQWMVAPMSETDHKQAQYVQPIIISKTEEIFNGDTVYDVLNKNFFTLYKDRNYTSEQIEELNNSKSYSKVLVLPKQFSEQHLEDIVEKHLKKGKIYVAIEPDRPENSTHYVIGSFNWQIKLKNNKVELLYK